MKYGSNKKVDGKDLQADSSYIEAKVGLVDGCTFEGIELGEDGRSLSFLFEQPSGAIIRMIEFDEEFNQYTQGKPDDQALNIQNSNARMKHICTKIVGEDAYNNATKDGFDSFTQCATALINLIGKKYEGMKFNMLFVYNKKNYVSIPKFPNFIEKSGTTPTGITISSYNQGLLVKKAVPKPDNVTSEAVTDDLPF